MNEQAIKDEKITKRIISALKAAKTGGCVAVALSYIPTENLSSMSRMIDYILSERDQGRCLDTLQ